MGYFILTLFVWNKSARQALFLSGVKFEVVSIAWEYVLKACSVLSAKFPIFATCPLGYINISKY